MRICDTFTATICCGLTEGYGGETHLHSEARTIVRAYCDQFELGVTFTPTEFLYKGGNEPGVMVGLISYPRFPRDRGEVRRLAERLAARLGVAFKQERVSVIMPDVTVTLEKDDMERLAKTE